jgi:hypothetical protein
MTFNDYNIFLESKTALISCRTGNTKACDNIRYNKIHDERGYLKDELMIDLLGIAQNACVRGHHKSCEYLKRQDRFKTTRKGRLPASVKD